jgi:hypothetical protein
LDEAIERRKRRLKKAEKKRKGLEKEFMKFIENS